MPDEIADIPEIAAKLYALAAVLEVAADSPGGPDPSLLIVQGKGLVSYGREHGPTVAMGEEAVRLFDAGAVFLRAWYRHDPDPDLIRQAKQAEWFRDVTILAGPPEAA